MLQDGQSPTGRGATGRRQAPNTQKTSSQFGCSFCDPAGVQTQNLQNRNLTLYSTKLQGQNLLIRNEAIANHDFLKI